MQGGINMFVEPNKNETSTETCKRCIERFFEYTKRETFDYSYCLHCKVGESVHPEDSETWNGHTRFLR